MRNSFKSKHKYNSKFLSKIILLTIILIGGFTVFLLARFTNKISNTLMQISKSEITRITYEFIVERLDSSLFNKANLEDILVLEENEAGEILYVDFDLEQAYSVLGQASDILTNALGELESGQVSVLYLDEELSHELGSMVLNIPIGNGFDNAYFYNLGPKIPVRINFVGSVLTNLKTEITDYGFNNALVEMFIYIEFKTQIISPAQVEEITLKYDAVIASMMVEGSVPKFYGGTIEKESSIYSQNIE